MKELKINYLALLVAVVIQFVLGFLWYGPLFGDAWMSMVGLDAATIEANPASAGVWITTGNTTVGLMLGGAVLGVWPKYKG